MDKKVNGTDVRIHINSMVINKPQLEIIQASHRQIQYIIEGLMSVDDRCFNIANEDKENVLHSIDGMLDYFTTQTIATIKYRKNRLFTKCVDVYCYRMDIILECEEAARYKMIFNKI